MTCHTGQLGKKWSSKGKMFDSRQAVLKSDDTNEFGHGLLHKAVIHNNVQDFRKLLENGYDINNRDELGFTPLHLVALLGRNDVLNVMMQLNKDAIDRKGKRGKIKLNKKIDLNAMTVKGQSATELCAINGHIDTLNLLLELGCRKGNAHKSIKSKYNRGKVNDRKKIYADGDIDQSFCRINDREIGDDEEQSRGHISGLIRSQNYESDGNCLPVTKESILGLEKQEKLACKEFDENENGISFDENKEISLKKNLMKCEPSSLNFEKESNEDVENICTKMNFAVTCSGKEDFSGQVYCLDQHQQLDCIEMINKGDSYDVRCESNVNPLYTAGACCDADMNARTHGINCSLMICKKSARSESSILNDDADKGTRNLEFMSTETNEARDVTNKDRGNNVYETGKNDIDYEKAKRWVVACDVGHVTVEQYDGNEVCESQCKYADYENELEQENGTSGMVLPLCKTDKIKRLNAAEISRNGLLLNDGEGENLKEEKQSIETKDCHVDALMHSCVFVEQINAQSNCEEHAYSSLRNTKMEDENGCLASCSNIEDHVMLGIQQNASKDQHDNEIMLKKDENICINIQKNELNMFVNRKGEEFLDCSEKSKIECNCKDTSTICRIFHSADGIEHDFDADEIENFEGRREIENQKNPIDADSPGACSIKEDSSKSVTTLHKQDRISVREFSKNNKLTELNFVSNIVERPPGDGNLQIKQLERYEDDEEFALRDNVVDDDKVNLCSDCRLKRKIESLNAESVNSTMGTSQSSEDMPFNDPWEVWELNNKANDFIKEWNSPNRAKERLGDTFLLPSRSLPDVFRAQSKDILTEHLRRHSSPDPACLPSWSDESKDEVINVHQNSEDGMQCELNFHLCDESCENHDNDKEVEQKMDGNFKRSDFSSALSYASFPHSDDHVTTYSMTSIVSPLHSKPDLPYKFCEDIYHIRSDSDLRGKYRSKNRIRPLDDMILSRSTSYLSQCYLEEVIDYFPCKDDAFLSNTSFSLSRHYCYDWHLSMDPTFENEEDHLTVGTKLKDDKDLDEPVFSYVCSENEDLQGSFVCLDCGTTVPHILSRSGADENSNSVDCDNGHKNKDEFVLICLPGKNDVSFKENTFEKKIGMNNCQLNINHRDEILRLKRLSGVHGSLENIEENDCERDLEDIDSSMTTFDEDLESEKNVREKCTASQDTCMENHFYHVKESDKERDLDKIESFKNGSERECSTGEKCEGSLCEEFAENAPDEMPVSLNEENNEKCQKKYFRNRDHCSSERDAVHGKRVNGQGRENNEEEKMHFNNNEKEFLSKESLIAPSNALCFQECNDEVNCEEDNNQKGKGSQAIDNGNDFIVHDGFKGKKDEIKDMICIVNASNAEDLNEKDAKEDETNEAEKCKEGINKETYREETPGIETFQKNSQMIFNGKSLFEEKKKKEGECDKEGSEVKEEEKICEEDKVEVFAEERDASYEETEIIEVIWKEVSNNTIKRNLKQIEAVNKVVGDNASKTGIETCCHEENAYKATLKDEYKRGRERGKSEEKFDLEERSKNCNDEEYLSPLQVIDSEVGLNFSANFREMPQVKLHVSSNISIKNVFKNASSSFVCITRKQPSDEGSTLEKVGHVSLSNQHADLKRTLSADKSKNREKYNSINYQNEDCKLNFCLEGEKNVSSCKCTFEENSYGCLKCSCERGISESTSESLISNDTGIDVDDLSVTDWEEFNQCLDMMSLAGDRRVCNRTRVMSSTPLSRKASVDYALAEEADKESSQGKGLNKANDQQRNTENDLVDKVFADVHRQHVLENVKLNSQVIEKSKDFWKDNELKREKNKEDCAIIDTEDEIRKNVLIENEHELNEENEIKRENADIPMNETENVGGKEVKQVKKSSKKSLKFDEVDLSSREVLNTPMEECEISERDGINGFTGSLENEKSLLNFVDMLANKRKGSSDNDENAVTKFVLYEDDKYVELKLFICGFENEDFDVKQETKSEEEHELAVKKHAQLSNAIEVIIKKKKSKRTKMISCFNICDKVEKVKISGCWFMTNPSVIASVLIKLAQDCESQTCKVKLANIILSNVCLHKTCSINAILNHILIKLGFLKSESQVRPVTNASFTLLMFSKLISESYFELHFVRQLAFVIARPNLMLKCSEEEARKEFLLHCLKKEICGFSFSCKYPFKIYVTIQLFLSNLEDDYETAFKTLDKLLIFYLHEQNCLDFVSDVLIYLGLLKSEFPVNVTANCRSCLFLLAHIVKQSYFPLNGVIILDSFIKKESQSLNQLDLEESRLKIVLQKRMNAGMPQFLAD